MKQKANVINTNAAYTLKHAVSFIPTYTYVCNHGSSGFLTVSYEGVQVSFGSIELLLPFVCCACLYASIRCRSWRNPSIESNRIEARHKFRILFLILCWVTNTTTTRRRIELNWIKPKTQTNERTNTHIHTRRKAFSRSSCKRVWSQAICCPELSSVFVSPFAFRSLPSFYIYIFFLQNQKRERKQRPINPLTINQYISIHT